MSKPVTFLPRCLCGCGRTVKRAFNRYYTLSCVPLSARSLGGRKSRARYSLNRKARLFADLVRRLDAVGKPTRGDLVGLFADAYQRGYDNGYHASERKFQRRAARTPEQAA